MTHPIYPCLWFDGQAKAAAEFYCTIFPDAHIIDQNAMVVRWKINETIFMGLNGGPMFPQSEAVSFVIECKDQAEIDYYWQHLTADGGMESQCGWCKDKFGVSWQVIPSVLRSLLANPDKVEKVTQAFLKMKKFDIQALLDA